MARPVVKLALATTSVLFALVASEGYCRVAVMIDNGNLLESAMAEQHPIPTKGKIYFKHIIRLNENPNIIYELKPGLEDVEYLGAALNTNSSGFRGPEVLAEKPDNTIRILGIGDSVMFGQGVLDEETYLHRLGVELNRRLPDKNWEFINTGVPGYNTVLEVETLVAKGLELDFDAVFLGLVQNDFELPIFTQERRDPWTTDRLYLPEFVFGSESDTAARKGDAPGLQSRDMERGRDALSDPEAQPEHLRNLVGNDAFRDAMQRLAELSREHGFPVITHSYKYSRNCDQMLEVSEELGFSTFSNHDVLKRYWADNGIKNADEYNLSDLVLNPSDHHPSAKLHGLIANWFLDDLNGIEFFKQLCSAAH